MCILVQLCVRSGPVCCNIKPLLMLCLHLCLCQNIFQYLKAAWTTKYLAKTFTGSMYTLSRIYPFSVLLHAVYWLVLSSPRHMRCKLNQTWQLKPHNEPLIAAFPRGTAAFSRDPSPTSLLGGLATARLISFTLFQAVQHKKMSVGLILTGHVHNAYTMCI